MSKRNDMDYGAVAFEWWRELVPAEDGAQPVPGWKRATLARLRRANEPLEVMMEPYSLCLVHKLSALRADPDRVATLAGILAVVRKDVREPVTHILGRQSLDDDTATLSEGRFRRLLQTPTNDLLDPMRRLVRLAQNEVNVRHLATSILYWGEATKKRWIFDYYGASSAIRSPSRSEPGATPNQTQGGDV